MKEEEEIDNSKSILEKIAKVYTERLLSDITLQVECQQYPAHRLILCASSDVFQVMLMNPSWHESQEQTIILKEDPACIPVFSDFLKYLYTGKLDINYQNVLPLLALADKYNVKDLIDVCVEFMHSHVASASIGNQLVSWFQYCQNSGHGMLASVCENFVLWNFKIISNSNDMEIFDKETFIKFLKSSDLIVQDEMTLFDLLFNWLALQEYKIKSSNLDGAEDHFKNIFHEVMAYIRFPMMTHDQLASLLIHPLTKYFKEYLMEKVAVSFVFHSKCLDDKTKPLVQQCDYNIFRPRLYTAERWCATLTVENYKKFPLYGVRTLLFSTPSSVSDNESDKMHEWSVDFYPKGFVFEKFYLIVCHGTVELPKYVSDCVRLAVMSKSILPEYESRVNIAILLFAMQNGIEYVHQVVFRQAIFSQSRKVVNFDDLVPYNMLNSVNSKSPYHVGSRCDTIKLQIIITPNDNILF